MRHSVKSAEVVSNKVHFSADQKQQLVLSVSNRSDNVIGKCQRDQIMISFLSQYHPAVFKVLKCAAIHQRCPTDI